MKFPTKILTLVPIILISIQLSLIARQKKTFFINPDSSKNIAITNLKGYLKTAGLDAPNLTVRDYNHEIEFQLHNPTGSNFDVILSTNKNLVNQVAALQSIIKIVNIKGKELKFIDLSQSRPYATF